MLNMNKKRVHLRRPNTYLFPCLCHRVYVPYAKNGKFPLRLWLCKYIYEEIVFPCMILIFCFGLKLSVKVIFVFILKQKYAIWDIICMIPTSWGVPVLSTGSVRAGSCGWEQHKAGAADPTVEPPSTSSTIATCPTAATTLVRTRLWDGTTFRRVR